MNKNILKVLCISFIMLFSAFFINIDGVMADSNDNGIRCRYIKENNGNASWKDENQEMAQRLILDVYYGKGDSNDYNIKVSCTRYNGLRTDTNCVNTQKLKKASDYKLSFVNEDGTYKCPPTIYGYYGNTSKPFELSAGLVQGSINQHWNYKAEFERSCGANKSLNGCENQTDNDAFDENSDNKQQESLDGTGSERKEDQKKDQENDLSGIIHWGNKAHEGEYKHNKVGDDCSSINPIAESLSKILWIVDIIAIIILIIMTSVDLIKAITGSEEDNLKTAFKHMVTRIIIIFILFLLPVILGMIINVLKNEGTIQIGEDGNPFCDVRN